MAKRKTTKDSGAQSDAPQPAGWIVTTNNERPIREVAQDLAQAGFQVRDVLEEIGSITGQADPSAIKKARRIKGVADVAADLPIDIGDPNADVTW